VLQLANEIRFFRHQLKLLNKYH